MSFLWPRYALPSMDEEAVKAATTEAQQARAELIAEREAIMRTIALLEERRKANHFGDNLEVTFRPRPRRRRSSDGPAES